MTNHLIKFLFAIFFVAPLTGLAVSNSQKPGLELSDGIMLRVGPTTTIIIFLLWVPAILAIILSIVTEVIYDQDQNILLMIFILPVFLITYLGYGIRVIFTNEHLCLKSPFRTRIYLWQELKYAYKDEWYQFTILKFKGRFWILIWDGYKGSKEFDNMVARKDINRYNKF